MVDETIRIKCFKIIFFFEAPYLEYFCNETFLLIFQHGDVGSEVDALVHEHKSRYPSRKGKKIIGFAECWCPTLFSPSIIKMVSDANNNLILVVQLQSDFFRYWARHQLVRVNCAKFQPLIMDLLWFVGTTVARWETQIQLSLTVGQNSFSLFLTLCYITVGEVSSSHST